MSLGEAMESFPCFGGVATVAVLGAGPGGAPGAAVALARRRLEEWHAQFSRFEADSELSRLNADPRTTVPVSPVMGRLIAAILDAAQHSGGLVDGTLVDAIEEAGYARPFASASVPLAAALALAPARTPAGPDPRLAVARGRTRSRRRHRDPAPGAALRRRRPGEGPLR